MAQIEPYLGDRILEVGCGTGNFSGLLAQPNRHVTAIDCNPDYVERAIARFSHQKGLEFHTADATQQTWPAQFDTIILLDVLEHIADDTGFLRQLATSLAPGGYLILKVPALPWLYNAMDRAIGHHRRYSSRTLHRTLHLASFRPIRIWPFNLVGILGWWMNGWLLRRITPSRGDLRQFNRWVPLLQAIEQRIRPPLGLSLFVVAVVEGMGGREERGERREKG